jgi:hypothetical protein
VQATGDTGTGEGLVGTVLLTDGHKTGHLNLGELDLAATEGGQGLEGNGQWLSGLRETGERHTRSATLNFCAGAAIMMILFRNCE